MKRDDFDFLNELIYNLSLFAKKVSLFPRREKSHCSIVFK